MKTLKTNALKTLFNLLLMTILLSACSQPNSNTESKVKVDIPEVDLQTAVISGNLEVVKQHISAGSDIDEPDAFSKSTPLMSAATFGKIEIAKVLIEAGADLTKTNNDGATPLHVAAFFCEIEIVQLLIDANADKSLKNNYGATARESVMGPFTDVKPIYEMLQQQLSPLGAQLDMAEIEKTRPVIAMMLQ